MQVSRKKYKLRQESGDNKMNPLYRLLYGEKYLAGSTAMAHILSVATAASIIVFAASISAQERILPTGFPRGAFGSQMMQPDFAQEEEEEELNFDFQNMKSVMFTTKHLDDVKTALNNGYISQESEISITHNTVVLQSISDLPAFFLSSIMYYSSDSWTLWLNGVAVRAASQNKWREMIIDSVEEDRARFTILVTDIDEVFPNWRDAMVPTYGKRKQASTLEAEGEYEGLTDNEIRARERKRKRVAFSNKNFTWDYQSRDKKVKADSSNSVFSFELGLYQTFNVAQMSIQEGMSSPNLATLRLTTSASDAQDLTDDLPSFAPSRPTTTNDSPPIAGGNSSGASGGPIVDDDLADWVFGN